MHSPLVTPILPSPRPGASVIELADASTSLSSSPAGPSGTSLSERDGLTAAPGASGAPSNPSRSDGERFFDALNALTFAAIDGAILRDRYEGGVLGTPTRLVASCPGCSHAKHGPSFCIAVPLFTRETKCACPMDTR